MQSSVVWENVFMFLDGKTLKDAALVCKDWNEIIGSSPALMNKFRLWLMMSNEWKPKVKEILSVNRNFQRMEIYLSTDEEVEDFVKISEHHGEHVKQLKFHKQSFNVEALQAFKNFPLLKDLKIEEFQMRDAKKYKNKNFPLVELRNLKKLNFTLWTSWLVLKSLRCPNLEEFSIALDFDSEPREPLMNFLASTKNLKILKLDEGSFSSLFSSDDCNRLEFQLENLTIRSKKSITSDVEKNFEKFLETQKFCLENITISCSSQSIAGALTKLKRLRSLNIDSGSLTDDGEFYKSSKPIENLKILITDKIPHEGLLGILPNLEVLKTKYNANKIIQFLSQYNPNLKVLEVTSFNLKMEEAMKVNLKNLKFLNIEYDQDFDVFKKFIENHPSIETLCWRYAYDASIFDVLSKMPNLKHLKFGGETDVMQNFFELSHSRCVKLETLEIIFEKIPGRPAVLFTFPKDIGQLLVKCPYVEFYEKTPESEFGYRISVCHTSEFEHKPLMGDYCSD